MNDVVVIVLDDYDSTPSSGQRQSSTVIIIIMFWVAMKQSISIDLRASNDLRLHTLVPTPSIGLADLGGLIPLAERDSRIDAARGALIDILTGDQPTRGTGWFNRNIDL